MHRRSIIAAGMIVLAGGASPAERTAVDPPKFELSVSPPFSSSGKLERFRAGDETLSSPPYRFVTTAAVTTRYGSFGPRTEKQFDFHGWSVKVYAASSKKVAAAYASTKDGYELKMTDGLELETPDWGAYMIARLRRKQFSWGNAVSFFSQFTQDNALYVPHNGHLAYQVWGVTPDHKFTVVAHVSVSHPKLADWGSGGARCTLDGSA